jgi:hypothetical protein
LAKLLGAQPEEIRQVATQAPAPPPLPSAEEAPPSQVATQHTAEATESEPAGARTHYATTLADLVADGVVEPGTVLRATYRGSVYEVAVTPDGKVAANGDRFDSLSQAARLLTGQKAVNGWAFWLTPDGRQVGSLRPAASQDQ